MRNHTIFENIISALIGIAIGLAMSIATIYAYDDIEPERSFDLKTNERLVVKTLIEPEFELMCRTVYAEAGNQGYDGKRLVAAVILNRVDDAAFPDTITDVLTAPRQFGTVLTGKIYKYELDEESIKACTDEMSERTNTEIMYFSNVGFINGQKWQKVGDHYFSTK